MTKRIDPAHLFVYGGTAVNIFFADKGEGLPKHNHGYPHATFCASGKVIVRKEGIEKVLTKESKPVNLVANEWHELEAAEDGTVFVNVFSEGKY